MNYQISLIYSNLVVRAGKDKIQIQVVNLPQDCKLEYQVSEGFEVNIPTKSVFQISSQTSLKGTFKITMKNNQGEVLAESEELNIETIKVDSIEFTTKDVEITYGTPVDFDLVVTPEGALDEEDVMLDLPDGIEFVEGKLEATYPGAVGTVKAKVFDLVAEKKVSTKGLKVTAKSAFVIGKNTNLVVIASPNKPVTFESTDSKIATVSSIGVVTCLKEGSCEIIVKCGDFTSNISVEPIVGFTPVEKLSSEIVSSMHIFGSIEKLFQYASGRQVVTSLLDDNFSTLYYIKTNSDPNIFEYELAMINKDFDKYQYLTLGSGEGPVDPSQGVTQEQLNKAIQESEKKTQENIESISKDVNENIKPELTKSVKYKEFEYTGQKRQTIQLANYDSISGIDTKGEGHNLVMVSKWDKADFGAPKLPFNINGSEPRPTYNDNKELALLEDIKGLAELNTKYDALKLKYESLLNQLESIKFSNPVKVEISSSESLNQPEANLVISGNVESQGKIEVIGKSIQLDNVTSDNSQLKMTATDDIRVSGLQSSGNFPKDSGNASNIINTNEYVRIDNSTIKQSGYNCIEIGLNDTAPKGIDIEGIDFNTDFSNNAILIFAHAKDAVINIVDCHFKKASNILRLSNRLNVPATINLVNCKIDEWETKAPYQGPIILEDYTSTNTEEANRENRFANLTINFNNVIGPDGKVIKPEDVSAVMGTGQEGQIAYIFHDNGDDLVPYDESKYPKFTFK